MDQGLPEADTENARAALGQFGLQLVTTDAGQLQGQVSRAGLDGIQCLQVRIQLGLTPADLGPLQCNCLLFRRCPGCRRWAQHLQLGL
ncbi:hypothetical protein D3C76_1019220 [compost metagenome]